MIIGAYGPRLEPWPELVSTGRRVSRIRVAVLDGGVAVRCNPKPALAGLKSRSRSCVHRPTAGSAALKAWSCAATTFEPCQIRKEAAVRSARRVPQGRRARAKRVRGCGGAAVDNGCTAIFSSPARALSPTRVDRRPRGRRSDRRATPPGEGCPPHETPAVKVLPDCAGCPWPRGSPRAAGVAYRRHG